MKTEAAVYKDGKFDIVEYELPDVVDNSVRIKMLYAGICDHLNSWITSPNEHRSSILSEAPCIFGDEGIGIVEEVGGNYDLSVGDRVVISRWGMNRNIPMPTIKSNIIHSYPYTLARNIVLPSKYVYKVPYNFENIECAIMGCSHIAGMSSAYNYTRVADWCLIVGCNGFSLGAIMMLKECGASEITVADRNSNRLFFGDRCGGGLRIMYDSSEMLYDKVSKLNPLGYDLIVVTDPTVNMSDILSLTKYDGGISLINYDNNHIGPISTNIISTGNRSIIICDGSDVDVDNMYVVATKLRNNGRLPIYKAINTSIYDLKDIDKAANDIRDGSGGRYIIKCFNGSIV